MTIRFKIIHFVPDPFSGARVPVGVVAQKANGAVKLVTARSLPSASCLGSGSAHASLALLMEDLRKIDSFDVDVGDIGPHLSSSDEKRIEIPRGDIESWFRNTLFPKENDHEPKRRSPNRATEGKRFLSQYGVYRYVSTNFNPGNFWTARGHRAAFDNLDSISHYVGDMGGEVLLMEPLVPRRSSFESDLQIVNMKFGAYRHFLGLRNGNSAELIAYILPGDDGQRATARKALRDSAQTVVDGTNVSEREDFFARIREVGERTQPLI